GAHIADLVEAATGLNLWAEWARLEARRDGQPYTLPPVRQDYAGLMVSLARQQWPDLSHYNAPEVVWRLQKANHAGLIVAAPQLDRVESLLAAYTDRFYQDFFASASPRERPSE
ncbi:MAG: ATPase, partial [Candidatus Acidiferrales bacterium]